MVDVNDKEAAFRACKQNLFEQVGFIFTQVTNKGLFLYYVIAERGDWSEIPNSLQYYIGDVRCQSPLASTAKN